MIYKTFFYLGIPESPNVLTIIRGAEPGVFWVLTPPLFWAYAPHFLDRLKIWELERERSKNDGRIEKNFGGKKYLGVKKFLRVG